MSARVKLAALVESDPDVLTELVGMYTTAYYGGAVTALINVEYLPGAALSALRCQAATTVARRFVEDIQGDPAVTLSIAEGILTTLRGEDPEPTIIEPHASRTPR